MTQSLEERCRTLIEALDLGRASDVTEIQALTGGVASDIASVRVGDRQYCLKFALSKLKVAADWYAPVHRSLADYAWLKAAAEIVPESAVQLFGHSADAHGFAIEFLAGNDVYLWKDALLEGQGLRGESYAVGDVLGRIHAASTKPSFDQSPFQNRDDFRALRIEPYLAFTAGAHPSVAAELNALSNDLYDGNAVLIHGDASPKNVMIRNKAPIILDAECATMGDAAFDPSFCVNHLILKAVHLPTQRAELLDAVGLFWKAYGTHITWEDPADLEARICRLLPALMLARIDGKSPVEYLGERQRDQVRQLAIPLIQQPVPSLTDFVERLMLRLKEFLRDSS